MVPLRILPPTIQIIGRIQHTEKYPKKTSSGQPRSEEMKKNEFQAAETPLAFVIRRLWNSRQQQDGLKKERFG